MTATAQTIWSLSVSELHDRFWASRGVQVMRPGERSQVVRQAELFLLTDAGTLLLGRLAPILDDIAWIDPDLVFVRVRDVARSEYREHVRTGDGGRFLGFGRDYSAGARIARVGLTTDAHIARTWQEAADATDGWQRLRRVVRPSLRHAASIRGRLYSLDDAADVSRFCEDLVTFWDRPDAAIEGIDTRADGVWVDDRAPADLGGRVLGPTWLGAGRTLAPEQHVVGPALLWDAPGSARPPAEIRWQELEALGSISLSPRAQRVKRRPVKRLFDLVFASCVLIATLPLYPVIAAIILLEDGWPIFFMHERETVGGRRFGCIKFRSMRKNAEHLKAQLKTLNKADGPQFYIPDDPRLTRIGRIIRNLQIDELPQFLNVLRGEMSVVGPRPSPFSENQFCPGWREARLSVRPGITGLWQIMRTRSDGADFQEWIRYDIEYVERQSFRLDLWIIWKTIEMLLRKVFRP